MGKQHDQDNSYLLHGDARTYKLNFRMMHEGHCAALEAVPVARATPARCLTGVEAKKNSSSGAEPKEAGEDDSEEDEPVEIQFAVVRCHDAPEGNPSAGIIRGGKSVRRESGPEQRYDWAANDRSGRQKSRPCSRRAR